MSTKHRSDTKGSNHYNSKAQNKSTKLVTSLNHQTTICQHSLIILVSASLYIYILYWPQPYRVHSHYQLVN